MTSETIRIDQAVYTPTNEDERRFWLGAKVHEPGAEITLKAKDTVGTPKIVKLEFATAAEVAALEDVLHAMRVRMEARTENVA